MLVISTDSSLVWSRRPLPQLPCTGVVASSSARSAARFGPAPGGDAQRRAAGRLSDDADEDELPNRGSWTGSAATGAGFPVRCHQRLHRGCDLRVRRGRDDRQPVLADDLRPAGLVRAPARQSHRRSRAATLHLSVSCLSNALIAFARCAFVMLAGRVLANFALILARILLGIGNAAGDLAQLRLLAVTAEKPERSTPVRPRAAAGWPGSGRPASAPTGGCSARSAFFTVAPGGGVKLKFDAAGVPNDSDVKPTLYTRPAEPRPNTSTRSGMWRLASIAISTLPTSDWLLRGTSAS